MRILNYIYGLGEDGTNVAYLKQKIRSSNKLAVLLIAVVIPYVIVTYVLFPPLTLYPALAFCAMVMSLILNATHFFTIARLTLLLPPICCCAVYQSYLTRADEPVLVSMYLIQFSLIVLPLVAFDIREKKYIFVTVALSALIFLSIPFINPFFEAPFDNTIFKTGIMSEVGALTAVIILLTSLGVFLKTSYIKELITRNEVMESQRKKIEAALHQADMANRAKSIFLATMSHEIRTPMNGVLGMATLLSETPLTPEQKEYADIIHRSGEGLLNVINDILDFSKIESGKMELEQKDFNLRTCIEEVLDLFSSKAAALHIDLVYEISPDVPAQIIGDSFRLRQVLTNLVGNAVKFTQKGEVFIDVRLLDSTLNTVELGFEVRDSGIGIPPDKADKLFKVFTQVDSSTTRKYGGTGLGLVITEKLVALMGGRIKVTSEVGKGSTFSFNIRAKASQAPMLNQIRHSPEIQGKKVLVIDDNSTNLKILRNQLAQWGMLPTLVTSGTDAVAAMERTPGFDLIITDMMMPEMDGIETARNLRRRSDNIPIILLSSVGDDPSKSHPGLFSAVLTKPVKQKALYHHIVNHVGPVHTRPVVAEPDRKQLSKDFALENPLRILITEDNPVNLMLAERVMAKLGYNTDKAYNGEEAMKALQVKQYDLIFMDVQMPVMDGLEASRRIRETFGEFPIIVAMTANVIQGDREECLNAGMNDYISKPVAIDTVVTVLARWATHINKNVRGGQPS